MEAYSPTLGLLTYLLTHSLICPHNALVSNLKIVPGFRAGLLVSFASCHSYATDKLSKIQYFCKHRKERMVDF